VTDIVGAKKKIQQESVDYRSAISETTFSAMGSSINWIIENSTHALGTVVTSMLTLAQYQSELNSTWVLCDGASCVGSDYETLSSNSTVPDLVTSNRFLRQATNDGELGNTQTSANLSHSHSYNDYNVSTGAGITAAGALGVVDTGRTTGLDGGSESRPHNLKVNHFIKINL